MKEQKTENIYRNGNQALREALALYKPSELLYVPIEIGKFNHKASVVNFFGDVLVKPFEFANKKHGLKFFLEKVRAAAKSTACKKIFAACESCGHYHLNLVHYVKESGLPVEAINPRDTRKESPSKDAKTDTIDLKAIAGVLIQGKGARQIIPQGVYYRLQRATRTRCKFISYQTSSRNIVTGLVDRIFPGLWDKDDSIFSQRWGKGSLLVIEHYPHPGQVMRLGEERLARFLRKNNTKLGTDTSKKIVGAAKDCLAKPVEEMDIDILSLKSHIACLKDYGEIINRLERETAILLLQTPGTYLLSIPGISVTHASQFTGEVGDIRRFAYANQIISYAGSCPRVFESAEYQAKGLPISRRGSKFLRSCLNQAALVLNKWCQPFHIYYTRKCTEKNDRPGIARIATGNKFAKLAFALMKNEVLYRSQGLLLDEKTYYAGVWKKILKKLEKFDLSTLPQPNYLLKIKSWIEEKYGVALPLKV